MTWIAETWRTKVEPFLVRWDFANEQVVLPTGQTVTGFFDCCAMSTIIHEAIFLPCCKLSSVIPPDTEDLDCLINFTVTIIWWGLTNFVRGCEAEFEAEDLRREGPTTMLDHFSEFTANILAHGKEVVEHYSHCT
ncbi:hypothetical protein BKA82DRAFT_4011014 [Pisolithus tinctorius]|nr:hypothetical protein BKA82DRAFT_4011014 [Pisolithus tinctorius]